MIDHNHSTETWDEYTFKDSEGETIRVAVQYTDDKFSALFIRGITHDRLVLESTDDIKQLLTALHSAVAQINKKEASDGAQAQ